MEEFIYTAFKIEECDEVHIHLKHSENVVKINKYDHELEFTKHGIIITFKSYYFEEERVTKTFIPSENILMVKTYNGGY